MERSPYKSGDIIAQETWYNRGVNNVGLVISDELESVALVLWRVTDKQRGAHLLWTLLEDITVSPPSAWDQCISQPRVVATSTYLVHRPR